MTQPTPPSRESYYRQAESWNRDREDASRASRRVAWITASVAALIALAEACALVALVPLKTVQPYTLLVDRQTGYVQALDPLQTARINADTALTQSFVVQYVIARESFDIAAVQANYRKVASWSEGSVRAAYIAAMQSSNPGSPIATLPRSTVVETRVKSLSTAGRNTLLVRFDTQRQDESGQLRPAQPWIAVVRFRYTGEPMKLEDRLANPLGFSVIHYQRSAEALVPDANPASANPAAAASLGGAAVETPVSLAPPANATSAPLVYPRTGAVTPSPLRSVRQPRYVTTFPPPRSADGTPLHVVGVNRSGQPIVGPTP